MLLSRSQYRFHISSQVRFQNIPSQNNSYKKVLQFSKRSPVKDSVIYDFRKTHSHSQTCWKFKIGFSRLKRIERQFGLHQKRRKRVTKEYEAFIVEKALSGRISSLEILRKFKERFPYVKISRSTIIRTLDENKFRFRKPRNIQFLTKAHKFNRYNFCLYMLSNNRDIFELILLNDECSFCNAQDNRSRWIRSNDFREDHCARYKKYTFGIMVWGAIGKNHWSPLVFPKGKINSEEYVNFLKKALFFDDADQKLGKLKYVFQQDGATSHTTRSTYNYLEKHALILFWMACQLSWFVAHWNDLWLY